MTWSCRYCTFSNEDDSGTQCEMCGMPGKRDGSMQSTRFDSNGNVDQLPIDLTGNGSRSEGQRLGPSISNTRKRKAPGTTGTNVDSKTSRISTVTTKENPFQKAETRNLHSFSYKVLPKRTVVEVESEVKRVLKTVFQLDSLRNLQPQAVKCALELKSQMIIMATGGGK